MKKLFAFYILIAFAILHVFSGKARVSTGDGASRNKVLVSSSQ